MLAIFGLLFLVMFFRILYIQVTGSVHGHDLVKEAEAKFNKTQVEQAERGSILDANGVPIVTNTASYDLFAVVSPEASEGTKQKLHVSDPNRTATILSKYINMPKKDILNKLKMKKPDGSPYYQVEFGAVGKNLSHSQMQKIADEELPGINFTETTQRFYPNGMFASNIIGFSQRTENEGIVEIVGKSGLEKTFNKELSGENGEVNFSKDKWGYIFPGTEKMITPPKDGDNIYLTLDKTIQNILESEVSKVDAEYKPKSIVAVVADPKTGKILASTQRPTFNSQKNERMNTSWLNRLTETTIEPGSTMKAFTLATAIEKGVWDPNATFMSGQYTVGGRTIRDANQVGWGRISYLEAIQRSSNVGMANLLERIGDENFLNSIAKFGFGEKTGIDLPGEATGKILDQYKINTVTTTYGQGSTVTPIQLIQAFSAIANNGEMMKPYVINKIVDPNTGKVLKNNKPEAVGQPISAETAKEVRDILATTITSPKGTARNFASQEYEVSGKTGTAQIPNNKGGYDWGKGKFLYSFIGMAPQKDPQLVMYVAVEKPNLKGTEYGSEPVSKVFNAVMESSLKYMNVETDMSQVPQKEPIDSYLGEKTTDIVKELTGQKYEPIVVGSEGEITDQFPKKGSVVLEKGKIFLKTKGAVILPDFKGWSLRDVLKYKELSGINMKVVGDGYVSKQSVPAGVTLKKNDAVQITLKTPKEQYSKKK